MLKKQHSKNISKNKKKKEKKIKTIYDIKKTDIYVLFIILFF